MPAHRAKFVEVVERFEADVEVMKDGMSVPGDSIMGLLMLAASRGTSIKVKNLWRARGRGHGRPRRARGRQVRRGDVALVVLPQHGGGARGGGIGKLKWRAHPGKPVHVQS